MTIRIRNFEPADASVVNAIAVAAFEQYKDSYSDWPQFVKGVARMAELAHSGEIIVAEHDGKVMGAVAYIGPKAPKAPIFEPHWPIMRMLVVEPQARGAGIGRALAQECIDRAIRDGADVFALHTSPIMSIALPMYERMGFRLLRELSPVLGVPYAIYLKSNLRASV